MRGRKPIPAAVRRLAGNRSKRAITEGIVVPAGQPLPPWPLTKKARREWDRLCSVLGPAGVLTTIDGDALAIWAETIARYLQASAHLVRHGSLITGPNGIPIVNPAQAIIRQSLATMQRYQTEFGATPSARMRVKGNQAAAPADPFEAFLADRPSLEA
jgi:P27 family predicted phage terminase small subunit